MVDIYVPLETTANVIKVDGVCYERVGESPHEATHTEIESTHTDCEECAGEEPAPTSCPTEGLASSYTVTFEITEYNSSDCTGAVARTVPFNYTVNLKEGPYWEDCNWMDDGYNLLIDLASGFGLWRAQGPMVYASKDTGNSPVGNYTNDPCQQTGENYSQRVELLVVS